MRSAAKGASREGGSSLGASAACFLKVRLRDGTAVRHPVMQRSWQTPAGGAGRDWDTALQSVGVTGLPRRGLEHAKPLKGNCCSSRSPHVSEWDR